MIEKTEVVWFDPEYVVPSQGQDGSNLVIQYNLGGERLFFVRGYYSYDFESSDFIFNDKQLNNRYQSDECIMKISRWAFDIAR